MVTVHLTRIMHAAPQRVFDWLAEPRSLEAMSVIRRAVWAEDSRPPGLGAVRVATGFGLRIREEITAYEPPRGYSYRIIRSFPVFDHEGGTLTLTPVGDGTHVDWRTTYTHPWYSGGRLLQAVTSRMLASGIRAVLDACAREVET
jgi:uncharacterized protein YndB with AHSA1/START domain